MNRCGSFPLLSASHSHFSIWTILKRSEKIPGAPTRRWGEWIWLTGPSGLHRNSTQGLNISSIRVFDQIRDPEIPITFRRPRLLIDQFNWNFVYSLFSKSRAGVFNLLSLRANLHLSYNPAGRSHCRLENHHGYIKHHHGHGRLARWCRWSSYDVDEAMEGL